jgi:hypothetical protein
MSKAPVVRRQGKKPSYEAIDYRLRPAKHAERLMVMEAAARLRFHHVPSYRYVGMGSIYFADFKLAYRQLGITSMVNIEAVDDIDRFEWNKPFSHIQMLYGTTTTKLPEIDWARHSIVWLDYDGQLSGEKLDDIEYLVRNVASGSMILLTLNVEKPAPAGMAADIRDADLVAALKALVGANRVKPEVAAADLRGKQARKVYHQIVSDAIEAALASYNAIRTEAEDHRHWQQIMHFAYKDGALMLTIGGIVYDQRDQASLDASEFNKLSFYRANTEVYPVQMPLLTMKEMAHLEHSTGQDPHQCGELPFLDPEERIRYLSLYRYLPKFASVDL